MIDEGIHLREIGWKQRPAQPDQFPFNIPVVRALERLSFPTSVTILVGENGCGKSTLLEAIALAAGSITVGREAAGQDETLAAIRPLASALRLVWSRRTGRGFFMRSEDFFGYARRMAATQEQLRRDLAAVDDTYEGRSDAARGLARLPHARELQALERDYGEGLDAQSHGESYLALFQRRFVPRGLYLLDEPEAPLSPLRQLSFLAILHEMVGQQAQFIIATHSPIVMAFPGATLLNLDGGDIEPVAYDDLEHVQIMRSFLQNPQHYLRHLLE